MTLGRVQERKSEEEIELVYYKRLLRKSPEKHVLLDFLADTYFKMANYEEAIHCWKKLLQRINKKGKSRIHAKIALTYEYLGEPEFSYHYYKLALKENPKDEYIIGKYGELAYIIENYKDALYAFKKVCELEPDNDVAWHNLALTYYNLG